MCVCARACAAVSSLFHVSSSRQQRSRRKGEESWYTHALHADTHTHTRCLLKERGEPGRGSWNAHVCHITHAVDAEVAAAAAAVVVVRLNSCERRAVRLLFHPLALLLSSALFHSLTHSTCLPILPDHAKSLSHVHMLCALACVCLCAGLLPLHFPREIPDAKRRERDRVEVVSLSPSEKQGQQQEITRKSFRSEQTCWHGALSRHGTLALSCQSFSLKRL